MPHRLARVARSGAFQTWEKHVTVARFVRLLLPVALLARAASASFVQLPGPSPPHVFDNEQGLAAVSPGAPQLGCVAGSGDSAPYVACATTDAEQWRVMLPNPAGADRGARVLGLQAAPAWEGLTLGAEGSGVEETWPDRDPADVGTHWVMSLVNYTTGQAQWTARGGSAWSDTMTATVSVPAVQRVAAAGHVGLGFRRDRAGWARATRGVLWPARKQPAVAVSATGTVVLAAGVLASGEEEEALADVWTTADGGQRWQQYRGSPAWAPRVAPVMVRHSTGLLLLGGVETVGLPEVWRSADEGATWATVGVTVPWAGLRAFSAVVTDSGDVVVGGGVFSNGQMNDKVWTAADYTSSASWQELTAGWAAARAGVAAAYDPVKDRTVFTGGFDGTLYHASAHTLTLPVTWAGTVPAAPPPWSPRANHAMAYSASLGVLLMGGTDGTSLFNDVWLLDDPDDLTDWRRLTEAAAWAPRAHFAAVVHANTIMVLAGWGQTGAGRGALQDAWVSTNGIAWSRAPSVTLWSARAFAGAGVSPRNGAVVVAGGLSGRVVTEDVWRSTDGGATWSQVAASTHLSARFGGAMVATGTANRLLLMGGCGLGTARFGDVLRSDDDGATWHVVTVTPGWTARCRHAAAAVGASAVVLTGGFNSAEAPLGDVWVSTNSGQAWALATEQPAWEARHSHAMAARGGAGAFVLVLGGMASDGQPLREVWRSTNGGNVWTQLDTPAWGARAALAATAMTDGTVVVFGGQDAGGRALADTWLSFDRGVTWHAATAAMDRHTAAPRAGAAALLLASGSLLLLGGTSSADAWHANRALAVASAGADGVMEALPLPLLVGHTVAALHNVGDAAGHVHLLTHDAAGAWAVARVHTPSMALRWRASVTPSSGAAVLPFTHVSVAESSALVAAGAGAGGAYVVGFVGGGTWQHTLSTTADAAVYALTRAASATDGHVRLLSRSPRPLHQRAWSTLLADRTVGVREYKAGVAVLPSGYILSVAGHIGNDMGSSVRRSADGVAWSTINGLPGFTAREFPLLAVIGRDRVLLYGGEYPSQYTDPPTDCWETTNGGYHWDEVPTCSGGAEYRAGATLSYLPASGRLVMVGGHKQSGNSPTDIVHVSNDAGRTWSVATTVAELARSYHGAAVLPSGALVIMGGRVSSVYLSDVRRSTDGGETWSLLSADGMAPWSARWFHMTAVLGSSIVLMGGIAAASDPKDMWVSYDGGLSWTAGTPLPSVREYSAAAVHPRSGRLLVLGRFNVDYDDILIFESDGVTVANLAATTGEHEWNRTVSAVTNSLRTVMASGTLVMVGAPHPGAVHYADEGALALLEEVSAAGALEWSEPLSFDPVALHALSGHAVVAGTEVEGAALHWVTAWHAHANGARARRTSSKPDDLALDGPPSSVTACDAESRVTMAGTATDAQGRPHVVWGVAHLASDVTVWHSVRLSNAEEASAVLATAADGCGAAEWQLMQHAAGSKLVALSHLSGGSAQVAAFFPSRAAGTLLDETPAGMRAGHVLGAGAWAAAHVRAAAGKVLWVGVVQAGTNATAQATSPFAQLSIAHESELPECEVPADGQTAPCAAVVAWGRESPAAGPTWLLALAAPATPAALISPVRFSGASAECRVEVVQPFRRHVAAAGLCDAESIVGFPALGRDGRTDLDWTLVVWRANGTVTLATMVGSAQDDMLTALLPLRELDMVVVAGTVPGLLVTEPEEDDGGGGGGGGGGGELDPFALRHAGGTDWALATWSVSGKLLSAVQRGSMHDDLLASARVLPNTASGVLQLAVARDLAGSARWRALSALPIGGASVVSAAVDGTGAILLTTSTWDMLVSTNDGASWTELDLAAPPQSTCALHATKQGDIDVLLLCDGANTPLLSPPGRLGSWIAPSSSGWVARREFASASLLNGTVFVVAGRLPSSTTTLQDVLVSRNGGLNWEQATAQGEFGAVWLASLAITASHELLLMGGQIIGGGVRADVWRSSDGGRSWHLRTAAPGWAARRSASVAVLADGRVFLFGGVGSGGTALRDAWVSSDGGATWTQQETPLWSARSDAKAVVMRGTDMLVLGGAGPGGTVLRDAHVWYEANVIVEDVTRPHQRIPDTHTRGGRLPLSAASLTESASARGRLLDGNAWLISNGTMWASALWGPQEEVADWSAPRPSPVRGGVVPAADTASALQVHAALLVSDRSTLGRARLQRWPQRLVVVASCEGAFRSSVTARGQRDWVVASQSAAGALQWVAQLGSAAADEPTHAVLSAGGGSVLVGGRTAGTFVAGQRVAAQDVVVAVLATATGATRWAAQLGSPCNDELVDVRFGGWEMSGEMSLRHHTQRTAPLVALLLRGTCFAQTPSGVLGTAATAGVPVRVLAGGEWALVVLHADTGAVRWAVLGAATAALVGPTPLLSWTEPGSAAVWALEPRHAGTNWTQAATTQALPAARNSRERDAGGWSITLTQAASDTPLVVHTSTSAAAPALRALDAVSVAGACDMLRTQPGCMVRSPSLFVMPEPSELAAEVWCPRSVLLCHPTVHFSLSTDGTQLWTAQVEGWKHRMLGVAGGADASAARLVQEAAGLQAKQAVEAVLLRTEGVFSVLLGPRGEANASLTLHVPVPHSDGTYVLEVTNGTGEHARLLTRQRWRNDGTPPFGSYLSRPPAITRSPHASFAVEVSEEDAAVRYSLNGGEWVVLAGGVSGEDLEPPIVWLSNPPPRVTSSTSATIVLDANEPLKMVLYRVDGGPWRNALEVTVELTGLADGWHAVQMLGVDLGGNVAEAAVEHAWEVDTMAPADCTLVHMPSRHVPLRAALFVPQCNEPLHFLRYRLDGGAWLATGTLSVPASVFSRTLLLVDLASGQHTVELRPLDAAGNEGASLSHEWTVDASVSLLPGNLNFTIGPLAEGNHSLLVEMIDSANLRGVLPLVHWVVDLTPPVTRLHWASVGAHTSLTCAAFVLAADEPAASFQYRIEPGLLAWTPVATNTTHVMLSQRTEVCGLQEGTQRLQARATDLAGNVGNVTLVHEWEVDTTPPATEVVWTNVAAFSPTTCVSFVLAADEAVQSCEYHIEPSHPAWTAVAANDSHPVLSARVSVCALLEGEQQLRGRCTDLAGNLGGASSEFEWEVDLTPPVTEVAWTDVSAFSGTDCVSFVLAANESATVFEWRILPEHDSWTAVAVNGSNPLRSVGLRVCNLTEGSQQLQGRATDRATNQGVASAAFAWEVDLTPPVTEVAWTDVSAFSGTDCISFVLAADEPATAFEWRSEPDNLDWTAVAVNNTNPLLSAVVRVCNLTEGENQLQGRATDRAVNVGPPSAMFEWEVDLTPPVTEVAWTNVAAFSPSTCVSFVLAADEPATAFEWRSAPDNANWTAVAVNGSNPLLSVMVRVCNLTEGSQQLQGRATDRATNLGAESLPFEWEVDLTPPATALEWTDVAAFSPTTCVSFVLVADEPATAFEWRSAPDNANWTTVAANDTNPLLSAVVQVCDLTEGSQQLQGRATDRAINLGAASVVHEWEVDLTPPVTEVAWTDAAEFSPTTCVSFVLAADEPATAFEWRVLPDFPDWVAVAVNDTNPLMSVMMQACNLTEGEKQLQGRATDRATNVGQPSAAHEWEVDLTPPVTEVAWADVAAFSPTTCVSFVLAADEPATAFEWRILPDNANWTTAGVNGSHVLLSQTVRVCDLTEGEKQLQGRATDRATNLGAESVPFEWEVDLTPPATALAWTDGAEFSPTTCVSFTLAADEPATAFEWRVLPSHTDWVLMAVNDTNPLLSAVVQVCDLTEGSQQLQGRATDRAINLGASSVVHEWEVDLTPPVTEVAWADVAAFSPTTCVSFVLAADEPATAFEWRSQPDNANWTAVAVNDTNPLLSVPVLACNLTEGSQQLQGRATDRATNLGAASAPLQWRIDLTPPALVWAGNASVPAVGAGRARLVPVDGVDAVVTRFALLELLLPVDSLLRALSVEENGTTDAVLLLNPCAAAEDDGFNCTGSALAQTPAGVAINVTFVYEVPAPGAAPRLRLRLLLPSDALWEMALAPVDLAGNRGAAVPLTVVYDTHGPTPVWTEVPQPLVTTHAASLAAVGEDEASQLLGGALAPLLRVYAVVTLLHGDGGPWQLASPALLAGQAWQVTVPFDGRYAAEAWAVDAAGNASPNRTSVVWVLDSTPPTTAAVLVSLLQQPPRVTSATAVTLAVTASEPVVAADLRLRWAPATHADALEAAVFGTDDPSLGAHPAATSQQQLPTHSVAPAAASFQLPLSGLQEATYWAELRTRDVAGNLGEWQVVRARWAVDLKPPVVSLVTTPRAVTPLTQAVLAWSASELVQEYSLRVRRGGTQVLSQQTTDEDATFTVQEGSHDATVWAVDLAGNSGQATGAAIAQWRVDVTPPTLSLSPPLPAVTRHVATSVQVAGNEPIAAAFRVSYASADQGPWDWLFAGGATDHLCFTPLALSQRRELADSMQGHEYGACNPQGDTLQSSATLGFALDTEGGGADGLYRLNLRAFDEAGNEQTHVVTWRLDRTPPELTVALPPPGNWTPEVLHAAGQARISELTTTYLAAVLSGPVPSERVLPLRQSSQASSVTTSANEPLSSVTPELCALLDDGEGGLSVGACQSLPAQSVSMQGDAAWVTALGAPLTGPLWLRLRALDVAGNEGVTQPFLLVATAHAATGASIATPNSVGSDAGGTNALFSTRTVQVVLDCAGVPGSACAYMYRLLYGGPRTAPLPQPVPLSLSLSVDALLGPAQGVSAEVAVNSAAPAEQWPAASEHQPRALSQLDPAFLLFAGGQPHGSLVMPQDGLFVLEVAALGVAGGPPALASHAMAIDTRAPATSLSAILRESNQLRVPVRISCAGEVWCRFHTQVVATIGADGSGALCPPDDSSTSNLTWTHHPDVPVLTGNTTQLEAVVEVVFQGIGQHFLVARSVDDAGNVGSPTPATVITVDQSPPTLTINPATRPPAETPDTAIAVEYETEDDFFPDRVTVEYQLNDEPWVPVPASPLTISGLTERTHVLRVRARDPAGNISPAQVLIWRVLTTLPSARVVLGPPRLSGLRRALFRFAADRVYESGQVERDVAVQRFRIKVDGLVPDFEDVTCVNATYTTVTLEGDNTTVPITALQTCDAVLPNLAPRTYTLQVEAVAMVGRSGPIAAYTWEESACGPGRYGVVHPVNGTIICRTCTEGAICVDADLLVERMVAQRGFWSADAAHADRFYRCPFQDACLGGTLSGNGTVKSRCVPGHAGVLCAVCAPGYYLQSSSCLQCPTQTARMVLLSAGVMGVVLVLCGLGLLVRKYLPMRMIKIMLGFTQVLASTTSTYNNAGWAAVFQKLTAELQVVMLDFIRVTGMQCYAHFSFYDRLMLVALVPTGLGALLLLVYLFSRVCCKVLRVCRSRQKRIRDMAVRGAFLLLVVAHPVVSARLLQVYQCREVEGEYFMEYDFTEHCYTEQWYKFALYSGILLVVFTLGFPLGLWWYLYRNRQNLLLEKMRRRAGFLYEDYSAAYYGWEVTEVMRKLSLSSLLIFFRNQPASQLGLASMISMLALTAHAACKPYVDRAAGVLQLSALTALFLTFLSAMMMQSSRDSTGVDNERMGVVLVAVNLAVYLLFAVAVLLTIRRLYSTVRTHVQSRTSTPRPGKSDVIPATSTPDNVLYSNPMLASGGAAPNPASLSWDNFAQRSAEFAQSSPMRAQPSRSPDWRSKAAPQHKPLVPRQLQHYASRSKLTGRAASPSRRASASRTDAAGIAMTPVHSPTAAAAATAAGAVGAGAQAAAAGEATASASAPAAHGAVAEVLAPESREQSELPPLPPAEE